MMVCPLETSEVQDNHEALFSSCVQIFAFWPNPSGAYDAAIHCCVSTCVIGVRAFVQVAMLPTSRASDMHNVEVYSGRCGHVPCAYTMAHRRQAGSHHFAVEGSQGEHPQSASAKLFT
eukprot:729570-Amphidinium_carterae.1